MKSTNALHKSSLIFIEIIGDLQFENEITGLDAMGGGGDVELIYVDVRLRRKTDKSRVKMTNIPPENFRISRDAACIEEADFVGIQSEMSRSDIRREWPEVAENIDNWDELGSDQGWLSGTPQDVAARKFVTGQSSYTDTPNDFGLL